jgi:23S rRNA (adenine2503-C2)-methyltransferase
VSRPLIYDLSLPELTDRIAALGQPAYRARQVWQQLYRRLRASPAEMTDLPMDLRRRLDEELEFRPYSRSRLAASRDGSTHKSVYSLGDGSQIETVVMTYDRRRTACISTQAGCAMACSFCATGQMGFLRNLTSGEIVAQALDAARDLRASSSRLTNIVVMGMGEPFHNYDATLEALDRLNDPDGMRFGSRRITASTVGLVPGIERFAAESRPYQLAVSLHAATDEVRSALVPVNRRYPLASLMHACREYVQQSRRRLTFEWALIQDVNDGLDQAQALAGWLRGWNAHVNLIPLNPTGGYRGQPTSRPRAAAFREYLRGQGIACSIRVRRGIDISAGCGQLATPVPASRGAAPSPAVDGSHLA